LTSSLFSSDSALQSGAESGSPIRSPAGPPGFTSQRRRRREQAQAQSSRAMHHLPTAGRVPSRLICPLGGQPGNPPQAGDNYGGRPALRSRCRRSPASGTAKLALESQQQQGHGAAGPVVQQGQASAVRAEPQNVSPGPRRPRGFGQPRLLLAAIAQPASPRRPQQQIGHTPASRASQAPQSRRAEDAGMTQPAGVKQGRRWPGDSGRRH